MGKKDNFEEVQEIFSENEKKNKQALSNAINNFNKTKSDGNRYNVARALKNQMQYLRNAAILVIMALTLSLTGCKKDYNTIPTPEPQMITQTFGITTNIKDLPMNKGFDPATFIPQYSSTQYVLTIQGNGNTYTRLCSVAELRAGSVSINMVAGTYDVTYTPSGFNRFTSVLNIGVNMTGVQINGSPIILAGNFLQSAIIVDIQGLTVDMIQDNGNSLQSVGDLSFFNHNTTLDYWYAYTNLPCSNLGYVNSHGNFSAFNMPSIALGKIYLIQPQIGVVVQINLPAMDIIRIMVE